MLALVVVVVVVAVVVVLVVVVIAVAVLRELFVRSLPSQAGTTILQSKREYRQNSGNQKNEQFRTRADNAQTLASFAVVCLYQFRNAIASAVEGDDGSAAEA